MEPIRNFFEDLWNTVKFIYKFTTDKKISRLRVLILWSLTSVIPSFLIYVTINTWQVHIPGVESAQGGSNSLVSLIAGTSILPILFFITNGLRGYHELFNNILESFFNNFEKRSVTSLCTEFGPEEGMKKLRKVDLGKYVSAFVLLEFLIIGWATTSYFIFGGNLTGLGWLGYVADDLLMGAIVFILEGVYCITDGLLEAPKVYKLKPIFAKDPENLIEEGPVEDPWTEDTV